MTFKIEIEKEKCIACGACVASCPDNFEMNDTEHRAQPKQDEVEELGCAQDAADNCPVECIHITKKE